MVEMTMMVGRDKGDMEDHFSVFLPEIGLLEVGLRKV